MTKIALVNIEKVTGCYWYRSQLPVRHCAATLAAEGITLEIPDPWHDLDGYDVARFCRVMSANGYVVPMKRFVEARRTYWDTDDHYRKLPAWNPARKDVDSLSLLGYEECLILSNGVTVSTPRLAEALTQPKPATVLPNLADLDDWSSPPGQKGRLTLMFAGGLNHEEDLRHVVPALRACRKRFGAALDILFMGYMPDWIGNDDEIMAVFAGGTHLCYFPSMLRRLAPDVMIAPLSTAEGDRPFNECKSSIKWIEATLSGAVCVAQDCPPYSDTIRDGVTGWLCDDADHWAEVLPAVLARAAHRHHVLGAADADVRANHVWQSASARQPWLDWFRAVAAPAAGEVDHAAA